ncbi:arabinose efflux permease family protein [Caldisphaera lagunensis DSM 15908]|uniref:Arabinose efflux permease family protein n=1 Tax=Caldisphaera lagunensis (strain DSM 15908 / JCM 11604 / ANMR 0165 / IC-154) TaxID=1056495 RepID=L0A9L4_CALLD|nr:MFS transporter [Caldisphaera lagunensis]AFZ69832.1 arabinose efflux permease family protein [Caldisphaera lagunensis DSM 15908]
MNIDKKYLWIVSISTSFAAILTPLDSTIVSISLPFISRSLKMSYIETIWVPLGYLIALTVLLLPIGRLSDIKGKKKFFTNGYIIFIIGTLMSGLSFNGFELDLWRIIQGIGAAFILAVGGAIITETYPPNMRGRAFGIWSFSVYLGTTIGPVIGGIIVSITSWRYIFFVTLPLAIIGYILSTKYIKETNIKLNEKMDYTGSALLIIGLFSIVYGLTYGSFIGWNIYSILFSIFGLTVFGLFLAYEYKNSYKAILDVNLLKNNVMFTAGNLAALLNYTGYFYLSFFISFYMQIILIFSPLITSIALISLSLSMVILSPISGWLSDKIGSRLLATTGMLLIMVGLLLLIPLGLKATLFDVSLRMIIIGVGMGLFSSPNTSAVMGSVTKDKLGVASGSLNLMRFLGQSLSLAIASLIVASYIPKNVLSSIFTGVAITNYQISAQFFILGLRRLYLISSIIIAVGAVLSALRNKRKS